MRFTILSLQSSGLRRDTRTAFPDILMASGSRCGNLTYARSILNPRSSILIVSKQ